jgi:hypothetical protein
MGKQRAFSGRHDMQDGYAWSARLFILVLCLAAASCALGPKKIYGWPQQEGVVVDKETGEPIAGVWVTGRWRGRVMGDTVCFHADATQTDAQGRFAFPAWRNHEGNFESSYDQNFVTNVYKQGYQAVGGHIYRWEMVPFAGSREERLAYIGTAIPDCNNAGYSMRKLYPVRKAIYLEAKSLSQTPAEIQDLEWYRDWAARAAVATDGDWLLPYTPSSGREVLKNKIIEEDLK